MLSYEENSGVLTFLIGIIVLVMAGVGLSILVDKRLNSSSGSGELRRENQMRDWEIVNLRDDLEAAGRHLHLAGPQLEADRATLTALSNESAADDVRKTALVERRNILSGELTALETKFSDYRANYRRKARLVAVGEKVGDLNLRGGRSYQDAVIREVTDVGIEIRHLHGIARVQAPDLGEEWQDRFQWSDEQRREQLRRETANRESFVTQVAPVKKPVRAAARRRTTKPAVARQTPQEMEEIQKARVLFLGWKSKLGRLENDKSEADRNASYGSQSSVPGSLETWRAKSVRLGSEVSKARSELAGSRAKLMMLSPRDNLLRQEANGN